MKYIDADKLRSVLQNTINSMKEKDVKGERYDAFLNGKLSICEELLGCIDSLQQQPAEWSEEDDNALVLFHELISFGYTERFCDAQTAEDMRRWLSERLKSTRPQPHWKPSKEQMKALEDAFRKDGGNEYRKVINSLYCDLQKLL